MRILGIVLGIIALVLAFVSAFLSAAPFTPAVFVVALTIPMAVIAILLNSKKIGWLAIYWSGCAVLAFWTLQIGGQLGGWVLLTGYAVGLVISVALLLGYINLKLKANRTQ